MNEELIFKRRSFFFVGFIGYYCETQIDQCQSNPCLNGGICRTLINSFKCDCPSGYTVRISNRNAKLKFYR
jgi:hypothetical protein